MAMKKKGAYEKGCFVVLAILVLIILAVFLIRNRLSAPYRAIEKGYSLTNSRFPFESNRKIGLSRGQLETYVAVRQKLIPHLNESLIWLEAMRTKKQKEGGGVLLATKATKTMLAMFKQLQEEHIAALNEHKMSVNEYRWIGRRVFAALYQGAQVRDREYRSVWNSVVAAFVQGAPRIAKYRRNPPNLIARLDLERIHVVQEEIELVQEFHARIFEPQSVLYQEVSMVLQNE